MRKPLLLLLAAVPLAVASCGPHATPSPEERLRVVATTTLVADVVHQVGGEHIALTTLLPVGVDPHAFEPRPQDLAAVAEAEVVFANGAGLEAFLPPLLESAGGKARLVEVSEGIALLPLPGGDEHGTGDPHTWMDPNNVLVWVENITRALTEADPAHAEDYRANAEAYAGELRALDAWIREQVTQIPPARRKLVTDHAVFGYFAQEYGFEQIGAVIASFSTDAAPSARELATLEDTIRQYEMPAIFVGANVNSALAEQIAADTGVRLVRVYTGSLSEPTGEAGSYLAFMRYNVSAIVEALK